MRKQRIRQTRRIAPVAEGKEAHFTPLRRPTAERKSEWNHQAQLARQIMRGTGRTFHTRRGVNDGFTRQTVAQVWRAAEQDAQRIIERMIEQKMIDENEAAQEAMEALMTIVRADLFVPDDNPGAFIVSPKDKIAAASKILEFTKAKPAQQMDHTVRSVADQLDEMLMGIGVGVSDNLLGLDPNIKS